MLNSAIVAPAKIIWDYMHLNHTLRKADVLLVLGGHDLRVAEYAAKLFQDGFAPLVVVSGGVAHTDDLLKTAWSGTEAEKFTEVLIARHVPASNILLETQAKNTGENFSLSRMLLADRGINFASALVVTKPYMERRAIATGAKHWPDKDLIIVSPPITFKDYFENSINEQTTPDDIVNIMMGDLQRIDVYGKNGFQIAQEIPDQVWKAFDQLKKLGYTKHLI